MLLYFAFAIHALVAEFSSEQFFENRADLEPNMAEFELVLIGEGCISQTSAEIETILRSVFTGGVSVSKSDEDNTEDVGIAIDDLDKIGAIPGLFPTCTTEVRNVETVNSEYLPTPNHILDDLSDILEDVNDQTLAESRRLLGQLPTELSFKDNIGVARMQTSETCAAFAAASVMEIHENIEWGKPTSTRLSPLSVYAYRNPPKSFGMNPGDVFQILRDRGVAMETDWPIKGKSKKYVDSLVKSDVPLSVKVAAMRHRIIELKRYTGSNPENLKQLFLKYGPAMVGTYIYQSPGGQVDCDMWNKKPGYKKVGAHGMTAIAYNSEGILIRNSWGATWCDGKGNVLLPWNEVHKVLEFHFWKDAPTTDCVNFESDTGYKCVGPKKASCASFPCEISDALTCCAETRKPELELCPADMTYKGDAYFKDSDTNLKTKCSDARSSCMTNHCGPAELLQKFFAGTDCCETDKVVICPADMTYKGDAFYTDAKDEKMKCSQANSYCVANDCGPAERLQQHFASTDCCQTNTECKDHEGVLAKWIGIDWTCSLIKPHADSEDCSVKMSDFEVQGGKLDSGISEDAYIKDVCPVIYKDYCTTCASTSIDTFSPSASPSKSPSTSPSTHPSSSPFQKPSSKYVHVPDQTCEDHGYETITTEEDCKAAGTLLKKGKWTKFINRLSYRGNDRPTGCSFHRFGNVELWRSSSMGSCDINGYSGCFCKKPSEYVHVPDQTCEDHGYETITTEEDCKAAGNLLKKGQWTNFFNRLSYRGNDRPTGCSFHRFGNVELWRSSNMGACDIHGYSGCFCKKTSNLQWGQGIGRYHLTRGVRIYDGVEISTHSASVHACKMMCDTNSECKAFNYLKYSKKCTLVKSYLFFQIRSWWKSDLYRKSGL